MYYNSHVSLKFIRGLSRTLIKSGRGEEEDDRKGKGEERLDRKGTGKDGREPTTSLTSLLFDTKLRLCVYS